jgi:midasin (ATPase involved in ribosome maturation)
MNRLPHRCIELLLLSTIKTPVQLRRFLLYRVKLLKPSTFYKKINKITQQKFVKNVIIKTLNEMKLLTEKPLRTLYCSLFENSVDCRSEIIKHRDVLLIILQTLTMFEDISEIPVPTLGERSVACPISDMIELLPTHLSIDCIDVIQQSYHVGPHILEKLKF